MMDHSSEDESVISDSEIDEYANTVYARLKEGKFKVKYGDTRLRCPFCGGKKKQDYNFKDLHQHASGIGASNREAKVKAYHLALAKYLKDDLAPAAAGNTALQLVVRSPPPVKSISVKFVVPWMGIIVNVPSELDGKRRIAESGNSLKLQFSRFRPVKVQPLWTHKGFSGVAVVIFVNDLTGFYDMLEFEKHFEIEGYGKVEYLKRLNRKLFMGSEPFGWAAKEDDYNSRSLLGDHLRKHADLKDLHEVQSEGPTKKDKLLAKLTSTIDAKNKDIEELRCSYLEMSHSVDRLSTERDLLVQSYREATEMIENSARERWQKMLTENQQLLQVLDLQKEELMASRMQLEKLAAQNESEKMKLEIEKQKQAKKDKNFQLATAEQKKSEENILKLVEVHKIEKENALKRALELERQLDDRQKLQLEIEQLKGKMEVMKHINGDDNKKEMSELKEQLDEKNDELDNLESLNQVLLVKERTSNDELQAARKELITGLEDMWGARSGIIIKKMGELDPKAFKNACNTQALGDDADATALILCSKWQEELKNPNWNPFKIIMVDNKEKEIINEKDEKLQSIRQELGDGVYNLVKTALCELNEYNPSGRYTIPELWSVKDNRKASLKEAIQYVMRQWKSQKRKR